MSSENPPLPDGDDYVHHLQKEWQKIDRMEHELICGHPGCGSDVCLVRGPGYRVSNLTASVTDVRCSCFDEISSLELRQRIMALFIRHWDPREYKPCNEDP